MTNGPKIYAMCEDCVDEANCHHMEDVRLADGRWVCEYCYDGNEMGTLEDFRNLPSAAEWVTVRAAPTEKQMCLHAHGVSANNRCLNCGKDME